MSQALLCEDPISLSEASAYLPGLDGKKPSTCTLWRWSTKGVHGVRLETVRLGRRIFTSRQALGRFASAAQAAAIAHLEAAHATEPNKPLSDARKRSIERAERIVEGIAQ